MAETLKILEKDKEENKELIGFIKRFTKIKNDDVKQLKQELENVGIIKINKDDIAKIIDIIPKDSSDINKIFVNESLDENEINKILEIVKKHI